MIRAEAGDTPCAECGATPEKTLIVTIGTVTTALCRECGDHAATTIQDKLSILNSLVPSHDEVTSTEVSSFATYPLGLLLDELVMCTVNYHVGPLDADKRRIAVALMERLPLSGSRVKCTGTDARSGRSIDSATARGRRRRDRC